MPKCPSGTVHVKKKFKNNQPRSFESSNFDLDLQSAAPCGQSRVTTVDQTPAPRSPSPTLSPWLPRRPTPPPWHLSSRLSGPRRLAPRTAPCTVHTGPLSSSRASKSAQRPPAQLEFSNSDVSETTTAEIGDSECSNGVEIWTSPA